MLITRPITRFLFGIFVLSCSINADLYGQSILLIKAETTVYDSYQEDKIRKLTLKEDTWVNYKGKHGSYFKISNYFGKDQHYPYGVFEGYVIITSALDTASRRDYQDLILVSPQIEAAPVIEVSNSKPSPSPQPKATENKSYDLGQFYLGMSKSDAASVSSRSFNVGRHAYQISMDYGAGNRISTIHLKGKAEDALAVDGLLKSQIEDLKRLLQAKYGTPDQLQSHPSFLEIEENQVYSIAVWRLDDKAITLGLGEKEDLYYSNVTIKGK